MTGIPPTPTRRFGADDGPLLVYFHGAPGAAEEAGLFDALGKSQGFRVLSIDRFTLDPALIGERYYAQLATDIRAHAGDDQVDVVGFSIGAFVALQTCRHLGTRVRQMHLISAAAPLEAGPFLDAMAGKAVFRLAQRFPFGFLLLSYWQRVLAMVFPKALFRLFFASACAGDQALAADPGFQATLTAQLRTCFANGVRGYVRDVAAYVQPWADTLGEVRAPTSLWHGVQDNWSPVAMADYLGRSLPDVVRMEKFAGLSHYSCLFRAAPEIAKSIARA